MSTRNPQGSTNIPSTKERIEKGVRKSRDSKRVDAARNVWVGELSER
jgi:hypothetical protein